MIRILIADDHPVVRSGLHALLNSQENFDVIAEAENGIEAVEFAEKNTPDVILMDLQMPIMDGLAAIKTIKERKIPGNILVLTTYDSDSDILPALEAGALGYMLKDSLPEDLFRAVISTARGETVLAPKIAIKMARHISRDTVTLSIRETEVLQLASAGKTNREIADTLFISEATVKTHFVHIFSKLNVSDRTAAVTEGIKMRIIRLDHLRR